MKERKAKKCKICGINFFPHKSTQKVCNYQCAIAYSNQQMRLQAKKIARAEKKEYYEKMMTLSDHKKKVQKIFNKFIRLRDQEKGCVSCGISLINRKYDAGHFYPSTYEGIRFNEQNVHAQCVPCNRNKHGNLHEYRKRITERITQDQLDWLDENRYIKLKLLKDELKELYEYYKKKVKDYEKL